MLFKIASIEHVATDARPSGKSLKTLMKSRHKSEAVQQICYFSGKYKSLHCQQQLKQQTYWNLREMTGMHFQGNQETIWKVSPTLAMLAEVISIPSGNSKNRIYLKHISRFEEIQRGKCKKTIFYVLPNFIVLA